MSDYKKRLACACCKIPIDDMHIVLDLGDVPLAGFFPSASEKHEKSSFPLKLMYCDRCKLVQTDSIVDASTLFEDYRYLSSVGLAGHFREFAQSLDEEFGGLSWAWKDGVGRKKILEIGCNDGVLLEPLHELGADVIGVDPAKNIVKIAREKGLMVINSFF